MCNEVLLCRPKTIRNHNSGTAWGSPPQRTRPADLEYGLAQFPFLSIPQSRKAILIHTLASLNIPVSRRLETHRPRAEVGASENPV